MKVVVLISVVRIVVVHRDSDGIVVGVLVAVGVVVMAVIVLWVVMMLEHIFVLDVDVVVLLGLGDINDDGDDGGQLRSNDGISLV